MTVASSPLVTPFATFKTIVGLVTYDLLLRRRPGLEIDRIIRIIMTSLTVIDNKGYVNIIELCQVIGLINQGRLLSA
jgi:hypothetical protein